MDKMFYALDLVFLPIAVGELLLPFVLTAAAIALAVFLIKKFGKRK